MFTWRAWVRLWAVCWILGCGNDPISGEEPAIELPTLPPRLQTADAPRGPEIGVRELRIALFGELRGEIEPCGCPTIPFGGFERRAKKLAELNETGPVIQLDAGEMLLKGISTVRSENRLIRIQAILDLSAEAGVAAWTPGPTDLMAIGMEGLLSISNQERTGPPPISATWVSESGSPILPPSKIIEIDSLRVGVIGLSAKMADDHWFDEERSQVQWKDPILAARETLNTLPEDLDLTIALSNLNEADNERLATEVPELTLLLSTKGSLMDEPRAISGEEEGHGVLWVETPDRGRFLQLITLRLGSIAQMRPILAPPLQDWRDLRTARAQRLKKRTEGDLSADDLHASEALFKEMGRGRNLALVDTIPLAKDLDPTDEENATTVSQRVSQFKDDTLTQAAKIAAAPLPPLQPAFASSGACVNCHTQEFGRWSYSSHARAYETLQREGQAENPECVACHSTGFAQPGGFGTLERTNIRKFKAVQCEACHGPLKGHPHDKRVEALPITAERCIGCHDQANSPDFEFDSYLWHATCQSNEGLIPPGQVAPEPEKSKTEIESE